MEKAISESDKLSLLSLPIKTLMWRYCLPTTVSMLVIGVYFIVDGYFIGHYVGKMGLEDVILSFPMLGVLYAVGILIGMGASTLTSIKRGLGLDKEIPLILQNTIILVLISSGFFMLFGTSLSKIILGFMGANPATIVMAQPYISWFFLLAFCPIASLTFTSLMRNDERPGLVTIILISGGVINIFFDWLFLAVFSMGIAGAAIASMISQAFTAIWAILYLMQTSSPLKISFKHFRFNTNILSKIIRIGFPSFLMELYLSVIISIHNIALLSFGSAIQLTIYGIITYFEDFYYLLFSGIAIGIQPILSFNIGAKKFKRVAQTLYSALRISLGFAAIGMILIYVFPDTVISFFKGNNPELLELGKKDMWFYFWGLPLDAALLIFTAYFQAIGQAKTSSLVTIYKLVTLSILMYSLTFFFGVNGVWFALPISSVLVMLWVIFQYTKGSSLFPNIILETANSK